MKIFWASDYAKNLVGNAYGYRVHNETLRKYVGKIAELTDEAEDAVMILSPEYYKRLEGKRNWLFTMFEGSSLPEIYLNAIRQADYYLTPSTWVKGLFEKYLDPNKIFVIPHGVESDFRFKHRKYPTNKPFRYFWVGAPNPRKGWEEIINIWQHGGFVKDKSVELYLKTTVIGDMRKNGNVIVDGRNLSREVLVDLYHQAHCFVFPTRGEGFGLTLAEAMATGLPCISTYYSGVTDFFNKEVGYPVGYKMGKGQLTFVGQPDMKYDTEIAFPNVDEIAALMMAVRFNYEKALLIGWLASRRIKEQFTWERSAQTLVNAIKEATNA